MLEIGGDVYEISRSLGHQGLKTTEKYISLLSGKIKNRNKDLGDQFSFI
jgi:site-specific recombinase XerD